MNVFYRKPLAVAVIASATMMSVYSTTSSAGNAQGKPFVALEGQIIEVQGAISTLEEQVVELIGAVDSLEDRVTASKDAMGELLSENAFLNTLISGAYTGIDAINAEIDALSSDVEANEGLITTLQAAIASIETGQIDLEDNLQSQIDNNLALIGVLQNNVASINEYIALDQHITEGTCPDGLYVVGHTENSLACAPAEASGGASISGYFRYKRSLSWGRNVKVYCSPGDIATGGGFNAIQSTDSVRRSTPTGLNGWTVESVGNERDIQAYVICLDVTP